MPETVLEESTEIDPINFKYEKYEGYYGDKVQVQKIIDDCKVCGTKLVFTHFSDFKNLMVQETARCPECGSGNRKIIHILN